MKDFLGKEMDKQNNKIKGLENNLKIEKEKLEELQTTIFKKEEKNDSPKKSLEKEILKIKTVLENNKKLYEELQNKLFKAQKQLQEKQEELEKAKVALYQEQDCKQKDEQKIDKYRQALYDKELNNQYLLGVTEEYEQAFEKIQNDFNKKTFYLEQKLRQALQTIKIKDSSSDEKINELKEIIENLKEQLQNREQYQKEQSQKREQQQKEKNERKNEDLNYQISSLHSRINILQEYILQLQKEKADRSELTITGKKEYSFSCSPQERYHSHCDSSIVSPRSNYSNQSEELKEEKEAAFCEILFLAKNLNQLQFFVGQENNIKYFQSLTNFDKDETAKNKEKEKGKGKHKKEEEINPKMRGKLYEDFCFFSPGQDSYSEKKIEELHQAKNEPLYLNMQFDFFDNEENQYVKDLRSKLDAQGRLEIVSSVGTVYQLEKIANNNLKTSISGSMLAQKNDENGQACINRIVVSAIEMTNYVLQAGTKKVKLSGNPILVHAMKSYIKWINKGYQELASAQKAQVIDSPFFDKKDGYNCQERGDILPQDYSVEFSETPSTKTILGSQKQLVENAINSIFISHANINNDRQELSKKQSLFSSLYNNPNSVFAVRKMSCDARRKRERSQKENLNKSHQQHTS